MAGDVYVFGKCWAGDGRRDGQQRKADADPHVVRLALSLEGGAVLAFGPYVFETWPSLPPGCATAAKGLHQ
jgi:hypothetical protein